MRFLRIATTSLTYFFLYAPLVILVVYSFNAALFPAPWKAFTFKWYHDLFQEGELWQSFANSLIVAVTATTLSLTMAMTLIFFRSCGGQIDRAVPLFYGNLIIPETVLAVGLLGLFSMLNIQLGLLSIIVAHTILGLGFSIPILYIRYRQLDPHLVEASVALGATERQTFFRITFPLMRPTLIATALLIFIISFDDFILAYFTAGSGVQTLSLHLFSMIRTGFTPVINALSAFLLILSSIMAMLFFSPRIRSKIF